ncbi:DUF72 domain-containing protein [Balamuthia mandrillaris]
MESSFSAPTSALGSSPHPGEEGEHAEPHPPTVHMGQCSWTDPYLIRCGRFYPTTGCSKPLDRLRFYATKFPCVEVDSSNYAIPPRERCQAWVQATPAGFIFHVKAFAMFTQRSAGFSALPPCIKERYRVESATQPLAEEQVVEWNDLSASLQQQLWNVFNACLEPMHQAAKLGVVLFQYPSGFELSPQTKAWVLTCRSYLSNEYTMAVEFRSSTWFQLRTEAGNTSSGLTIRDQTISWAKEHGLVLVATDEFIETEDGIPHKVQPLATLHSFASAQSSTPSAAVTAASSSSTATSTPKSSFRTASSELYKQQKEHNGRSEKEEGTTSAIQDTDTNQTTAASIVSVKGKQKHQQEWGEEAGRLVPIVCAITVPTLCYIRIHRRHGSHRLLSPEEIQCWNLQVQELLRAQTKGGRVYVLWNTNFEDQSIQNAAALAKTLPPQQLHDWGQVLKLQSEQSKRNLLATLFQRQHNNPNKKRKRASNEETDEGTNVSPEDHANASLSANKQETNLSHRNQTPSILPTTTSTLHKKKTNKQRKSKKADASSTKSAKTLDISTYFSKGRTSSLT